MKLAGKVALITGGASGIGRATAERFAQEGARIAVADINRAGGESTVAALDGEHRFFALDVTSEADWQTCTRSVSETWGALDILVNCAGVGTHGPFEETTLDEWQHVINVNLTGVFLGCKHAVASMIKTATRGSIVNLSSIAGSVGGEDIAAYSASKGGVTVLTKSIALSCAHRGLGIRCNAVHPTYVDTEMLDPVAEAYGDRDVMRAAMAMNVPLGKLATAQDIANANLFLASDDAAMVTGTALVVDGGTTAGLPARHQVD